MNEKTKVLVAEAGEFRQMLVEALADMPQIQVLGQTDDGGELLHMTEEMRPDVVVMDLQLLHMDGVEVLHQLARMDAGRRPKSLVISSYAKGTMGEVAARAGADYQMLKPCKATAVAERILEAFGAQGEERDYEAHTLSGFTGVYYGQAALPSEPEDMVYLTDAVTENALVTSAEVQGTLPVYVLDKFEGLDSYDIFLNGAQAVVTIENPLAQTDRELILFRDSFGSSLAPLLLGSYAKVTLVDLRYLSSQILEQYVDFHPGQDVLFLYSAPLWNSGTLLK